MHRRPRPWFSFWPCDEPPVFCSSRLPYGQTIRTNGGVLCLSSRPCHPQYSSSPSTDRPKRTQPLLQVKPNSQQQSTTTKFLSPRSTSSHGAGKTCHPLEDEWGVNSKQAFCMIRQTTTGTTTLEPVVLLGSHPVDALGDQGSTGLDWTVLVSLYHFPVHSGANQPLVHR